MKRLRILALAASLGLPVLSAPAQTTPPVYVEQAITFSIIATDSRTNGSVDLGNGVWAFHHLTRNVLISKNNLVKSIAVDMFPANHQWTNWTGSKLIRQVNLTNNHEAIILKHGKNEINVTRFFTNSFTTVSNNPDGSLYFMGGFTNVPPQVTTINNGILTNYTEPPTVYLGWTTNQVITNADGTLTPTNFLGAKYTASASLMYFSVTTTNLCMSLIAASRGAFGNGAVTTVENLDTNEPAQLYFPHETFTAVGSVYVNMTTNGLFTNSGLTINSNDAVRVYGPAWGTLHVHPAFESGEGTTE